MKTLSVAASKDYQIHIGSGLLDQAGELAAAVLSGRQAIIVSDDQVSPLYARRLAASLLKSGFRTALFVARSGEAAKTMQHYEQLLDFLEEHALSRSDAIFALGGGTVLDLAGFTAATYLRGISLVLLPSTVLAAVDAAVGGKSALNLHAAKNRVGAIYQPDLVISDPEMFASLSQYQQEDGCAEIIKYGMIRDANLLQRLQEPFLPQAEALIASSLAIKRDLVELDEFDQGQRRLLNFGHTVGHALESLSKYQISHGRAVAAGMLLATRMARRLQLCDASCEHSLAALLQQYHLDQAYAYSAAELFAASQTDKKRAGETLSIVLPHALGDCRIHQVTLAEWQTMLAETMAE